MSYLNGISDKCHNNSRLGGGSQSKWFSVYTGSPPVHLISDVLHLTSVTKGQK